MNKNYLFSAALLIILGVGLVLLEERSVGEKIPPQKILLELYENNRYITTDELAERLIEGDPSVQLIDVRDPYSFMDYALPGAKNIPLSDILIEDSKEFLDQPGRDYIFYSNGDVYANQAWMLARRQGFDRLHVLKDGLNHWVETIIQPPAPDPTQPQEAFDLYQFRLGALQYFSGGSINVEDVEPEEKIEFTRKKKKTVVEGGC